MLGPQSHRLRNWGREGSKLLKAHSWLVSGRAGSELGFASHSHTLIYLMPLVFYLSALGTSVTRQKSLLLWSLHCSDAKMQSVHSYMIELGIPYSNCRKSKDREVDKSYGKVQSQVRETENARGLAEGADCSRTLSSK